MGDRIKTPARDTRRTHSGRAKGKGMVQGGPIHVVMDRQTVPLRNLKYHPDNARTHDMGIIVESLERHGQFRALIVQKSTGYVLAGNGTLEGMRFLRMATAEVDYVDVDERQALEILAIDNKANDEASYDPDAVAVLLGRFSGDYAGSGFSEPEAKALLAETMERETLLANLPPEVKVEIESGPDESAERVERVLNADQDIIANDDDADEFFEIASSGVTMLNPDVQFMPGAGQFHIPELRRDMLLEDMPMPVTTWVGPTATEGHDGSYLYVYSTDSTRTLPWDRTAMCFYINDERFESWWSDPVRYVERIRDAGIMAMVEHDFSPYSGHPPAVWLWNAYRTRWLARFAQEAGVKVIPNIPWSSKESEWALAGYPKEVPIAAIQVQTHAAVMKDRAEIASYRQWLKHVVRTLDIGKLLVYGTTGTYPLVSKAGLGIETVFVENRTSVWSRVKKAMKAE